MATNQPLGTLPEKMRAYAHTTTGKPSDVLTLTELPLPPLPQPGSSDVLVRITHTTALFGDAFMMTITPSFLRDKPCIPAIEFAGTVVAVDPQGVATPPSPALTVGAEVYGAVPMGRVFKKMPGAAAPSGALAEYVLVPASRVVRRPDNVSREHAAGLGGASSCTALALVQKAKLEKGQKALVYGSNGSVGTLALQIAREAVGPTGKVVAVCGPAGIEVAKTLGADEVSCYQNNIEGQRGGRVLPPCFFTEARKKCNRRERALTESGIGDQPSRTRCDLGTPRRQIQG